MPEHWKIKPLKAAVAVRDEKVEADVDKPLPYVGLENIESGTGRLLPLDEAVIPSGIANRFRKGDVLFCKLRPYLAKACRAAFDGLGSTELLILTGNSIDRDFLLYQLLSDHFIQLVNSSTFGARMPRASWSFIGTCPISVPPPSEQRAVAECLRDRTAKLDQLIMTKRALIATLYERRSLVVENTVTRGPAGGVRATDPCRESRHLSGSGWFGPIPSHWEFGNLRRFAKMKTGHTPSRLSSEYWDNCTVPWFTLADVWQLRDERNEYLGPTREKISEDGLRNSAAELLPAGTVVLSRTASVGYSGIMPVPMATSQDFWNWVCGPRLVPEYLLMLFRAMKPEFDRITMGSTHKTIYQSDAASLEICVPPVQEQRAIVADIRRAIRKIDGLITKIATAIDRLQEYRAALITAAVTGQIDVRGLAP